MTTAEPRATGLRLEHPGLAGRAGEGAKVIEDPKLEEREGRSGAGN